MANWTPDSLVAGIQKTVGSYAPPRPSIQPPILWGTDERLKELFGDRVDLRVNRVDAHFQLFKPGGVYRGVLSLLLTADQGARTAG